MSEGATWSLELTGKLWEGRNSGMVPHRAEVLLSVTTDQNLTEFLYGCQLVYDSRRSVFNKYLSTLYELSDPG